MSSQVNLFGIRIDALNMEGAVAKLVGWLKEERRDCRYVVTPNVDHVVKLRAEADFADAYAGASLVLADGKPVVMASRLRGTPLPGTVPGSDLVPEIFAFCQRRGISLSVFLLGAGPGVADRAAKMIESQWPAISVVGTMSPPFGFEGRPEECEEICRCVSSAKAELLVLGLGAPKQELWIRRHAHQLPVAVALCVGATIDFLAGEKPRAPKVLRALGLEWVHRMLSEPKRLVKRYAHDALVFPGLLLRELLARR